MNKEESLKQLNEQIQELERKRDAVQADIDNIDYEDFYFAYKQFNDDGYLVGPEIRKVKARFKSLNRYTGEPHYELSTGSYIEKSFLFKTKSEAIPFCEKKPQSFKEK